MADVILKKATDYANKIIVLVRAMRIAGKLGLFFLDKKTRDLTSEEEFQLEDRGEINELTKVLADSFHRGIPDDGETMHLLLRNLQRLEEYFNDPTRFVVSLSGFEELRYVNGGRRLEFDEMCVIAEATDGILSMSKSQPVRKMARDLVNHLHEFRHAIRIPKEWPLD